jgi:hypothetical protein
VNFDLRWEPECLSDLEAIYGDLETADTAVFSIDWLLARNPLMFTWELSPGSGLRLAWVRPYLEFPAVYLSFEIVLNDPSGGRLCLMKRARRANADASLS